MKKYSFEEKIYKKIEVSDRDFDTFNSRLGLTSANSFKQSNIINKINSFINVYSGNINWYLDAIRYEKNLKYSYMTITVLLIALLPIGIFSFTNAISYIDKDLVDDKGLEYYSSYTVAILTSIFAFHKVLNAWLAKRRLLSIFHEASSSLKANLYAFEDKWNNGGIYDSTNSLKVSIEFDNDLEKAITTGRLIANEERKKFYEYLENPEVDLGNIFTSAFSSASSTMANFRSKRFERQFLELEQERKYARQERDLSDEIIALKKEFASLKRLKGVTQANMAISNPVPESLKNMLNTIQIKMDNIQILLTEEESKL